MPDQHATPPSSSHRDSHDLSLSPRDVTRDSLVTNMLMSLDQFSLAQPTQQNDSAQFFDNAPWNNEAYSSDFEGSSQFSSPPGSRDYRSNSVSKPNTATESNGRAGPAAPAPPVTPRGPQVAGGASHSRNGRHTHKANGNSSIDTAYIRNNRWGGGGSGSFGRSPSMELSTQTRTPPRGIDYDIAYQGDEDYGAAPTPTIPGGPRHSPAASRNIPPPPEPATPSKLQRKQSTSRSVKSSSGKSFKQAPSRSQAAAPPPAPPPAMPTDDLDSAPAPSVGYNKAKEDPTSSAQAQPKEKPGFFRRVFGSSKTSTPTSAPTSEPQPSHTSSPSRNTESRPPSNRLQRQPSKSVSAPPSRDTTSAHSQNHPALQKKTSSFFRRRKKSIADEAPPLPDDVPPVPAFPSLNLHNKTDKHTGNDPPSPVSSLREVMNPYLRHSGGIKPSASAPLTDITNTATDKDDRREEFKREFSPDYEPSPKAKIRTVPKDFDKADTPTKSTYADGPLQPPANIVESKSNSFLNLDGTSDNEEALEQSMEAWLRGRSDSFSASTRDRGREGELRSNKKAQRILGQAGVDDDTSRSTLALPTETKRPKSPAASTDTGYKTAPSVAPSVRVEPAEEPSPKVLGTLEDMQAKGLDEPVFVVGEPTEDDRQKAKKIYDGAEDYIQKDKAAAWMGEEGPVRKRTLQAYMELYNFADQSILTALRSICNRLILRGETQQVDRILVAFSKRWCESNPNHGFKSTDVIHTICYSIMLLNTDLHLADIESKMTRSQFVKNTLGTIRQAVLESNPEAFQRPTVLPDKSPLLGADAAQASGEPDKASFRHSFRPPPRSETTDAADQSGPLVKSAHSGTIKSWEEQIESVLKSIYSSIRDDRLPLFGAEPERNVGAGPSQSNLSVMGMLKRSPSVLSKAPSEGGVSSRGRNADGSRGSASRWTSKSRSRPGLGRNGMASSRTSFDDDSSIWSPAMSSATWSRYSLGRTQGTMSQDSFGSSMPRGDYQQSIGFANALSQAIFREEDANGNDGAPSILSADISSTQLLEDDSLELAGPPWVKEGMVIHKHHLDGVGRRAKDRNWSEVFAVVQKGQMSLFSFNSSKSMRQKNRPRTGKITAPVGGGNWQDNALNVGSFSLRLTLASALPSPGYSRTRPYVWALSLPNGAVHLFQVGTPEIIREFVNSANYWSARLSTHPLVGGISNIEYGWSGSIVNNALVSAINDSNTDVTETGKSSRPGSRATHQRKSSAASGSFRGSSFDQVAGAFTHNSGRGKLPGDRVHITLWAPPTQSPRPSTLNEIEQLESLTAYVKNIEEELQSHNQLRSPMLLAFTPRGHNAGKAMANWERKSSYLLREIVKFRTYVDCLQHSETRKKEVYRERDLAQRAARGELSDVDMEVSGEEDGDETLKPQ